MIYLYINKAIVDKYFYYVEDVFDYLKKRFPNIDDETLWEVESLNEVYFGNNVIQIKNAV